MFKGEILENENRHRIYRLIEANQGIHLRELQRATNMPLTTLDYHLTYMARKGLIYSETEGHFKRYYTKPLDRQDKKVLSALRQKKLREIVLFAMSNKKVKYQELNAYFKLPHSTLSCYLKSLVDKGILIKEKIGYETIYTVKDEDRVAKVLVAHKKTFLDMLVDKTLSTWLESYPQKKAQTTKA
jgi:predicted transcriptional regulator